jgi:hypothetical protein
LYLSILFGVFEMSGNALRLVLNLTLIVAGLTVVACSQAPTNKGAASKPATDQKAASATKPPSSTAKPPSSTALAIESGKPTVGDEEHGHAPGAHGDEEHGHVPGAHGGIIVSLGRDYHVEANVTNTGGLQLYTLGNDETRAIDIEAQELTAYVKSPTGTDSTSIIVKPQPQPGDGSSKASLFVGQLPEALVGQAVTVTIPNITIAGERFRLEFTTEAAEHGLDERPSKVDSEDKKKL